MRGSMADIQSPSLRLLRLGKENRTRRKKKKQDKNIMSASAMQGRHNKQAVKQLQLQ